jgi:hypothetical protein
MKDDKARVNPDFCSDTGLGARPGPKIGCVLAAKPNGNRRTGDLRRIRKILRL